MVSRQKTLLLIGIQTKFNVKISDAFTVTLQFLIYDL